MSDERPMGQVIQIDEARIRDHHLGEMVRGTVRRRSIPCSMPKLTGCAGPADSSAARLARTLGLATMSGRFRPQAGDVNLKIPKLDC